MAKTLFTAAFLGVAAALLAKGFVVGFHAIQSVREDVRVNQAIMQKAESLRLIAPGQAHNTSSRGAQYAGYVAPVAPRPGDPPQASPAHLRSVTVTLCWTNCAGPKPVVRQREFQARLGRNGLPKYIWGT